MYDAIFIEEHDTPAVPFVFEYFQNDAMSAASSRGMPVVRIVPEAIVSECTVEATIDKAQVVRAAALAPARPSAQDRQVAAAATRMEAEARRELVEMNRRESEEAETELEDIETDNPIGSRFDVVV